MANPVLVNGLGSPQSIYDSSSTQYHNVGTRGQMSDGRVFYYARNGAVDLDPGKLVHTPVIAATEANLAVTATAVGQKVVNVTPGAITFTANQLAEGYLCVNDVDGEGYTYKIREHPAVASSQAFDMTLYDDIKVALTANSQVTMLRNLWADVVESTTTQTFFKAGVPITTITASEYGWVQTWGVCGAWDDELTAIGSMVTGGTGTAGQIEAADLIAEQLIGIQLYTGVATEYYPKFLTIAP